VRERKKERENNNNNNQEGVAAAFLEGPVQKILLLFFSLSVLSFSCGKDKAWGGDGTNEK